MSRQIRILIYEGSINAADPILSILDSEGLKVETKQVDTLKEFVISLHQFDPDAIISVKEDDAQVSEIMTKIETSGKDIPLFVVSKDDKKSLENNQKYKGIVEHIPSDDLTKLVPFVRKISQKVSRVKEPKVLTISEDDSFHRFFALYEQSPLGILIIDPTTFLPIMFNTTAHRQLGYSREEFKNIHIYDFEANETKQATQKHQVLINKKGFDSFDTRHRTKQGEIRFVHVTVQSVIINSQSYLHCIYEDITERRKVEERNLAERELLQICNEASSSQELLHKLLTFFKTFTGCEAVGIRLQKGVDFPYFETNGFPEEFVRLENTLCSVDDHGMLIMDTENKPFLECMCGNIISGRFDPSKSFYTKHGSFWSGNTTLLLAPTTEADRQVKTLNRCNNAGYESVALIPIRLGNKTYGLFQLNDKRINWHTLDKIEVLEHMVDYVAIALAKQVADESLVVSEQSFKEVFNSTTEAIFIHDAETGQILDVNDTMVKTFGFASKAEVLSKTIADISYGDAKAVISKALDLIRKASLEGPQIFEWLVKRNNGSTFWAEIVLNRSMIGGKNRVLAVLRDISERKRMEEALNYSMERYRLLFEEMTEGFALHEIILNEKGVPIDYRFLDANPAFETLTGLKRDSLVGHTVKEILPGTEDFWIEKYGEVALHGEELQYENYSNELGKWYKVIAYCPKFGQFATIFEDITNKKIGDIALQESEEQFRSTFEQSSVGMCMVSMDGTFLRVNQAFCGFIGYSSDELIGNSIFSVTHSEDHTITATKLEQPQKGGDQNLQFEKRFIHKNGDIVWGNISSTLIHETNGNPRYFITQVQAITERKKVEEALELRDKIFTHSLDMLFVAGFDGFLKVLNPAWENNLGWTIGELTSKPWLDFVYSEDKERTDDIKIQKLDNGNEIVQFENRYICKDGSIKWLSWNSFPYPDENIIIGVARDITEKKALDESLRQSEERYHLINEASNDLISSFDLQGRFTHANSTLCKLMGHKPEEIIGKTFSELGFPEDQCEEWDRLINQVIKADSTITIEQTATEMEKEPKFYEVVMNPIHNEVGEVIGIAASSRDITSRKMAETKIQEQMDELRRWNAVTLGRENRIMELKQEVNQLLKQMDQLPRYDSGTNSEITHD